MTASTASPASATPKAGSGGASTTPRATWSKKPTRAATRPNTLTTRPAAPFRSLDAKGGVKKLAYGADGQLASYTDCSGHSSQWEYDERKRLVKSIDAAGNATSYRYTPLSAETLAQAHSEGAGNHPGQLEAIVYPDGSQEQLRHDAEGRLLSHTDALRRTTAYRYTGAGSVARRTDALGHSLHYRWDALGRLAALENENGSVYRFQYDPVGRLLQEQGFDGKTTEYRYNEATGVLAETVDAGRDHQTRLRPHGPAPATPRHRSGSAGAKRNFRLHLQRPAGRSAKRTRPAAMVLRCRREPGARTPALPRPVLPRQAHRGLASLP